MTNQSPFGGRASALYPVLPKGEVLATYETYNEAQLAVDVLAKSDFPVKQLSIVGNDLKTVERVTGKLTWSRVALAGAASGAWLGVFFGLLFFIFSPDGAGLPLVIAAVLMGAGFGMLFGLVSYALNRRRKDFTSTMQVIAGNYQVIVDVELLNRARNLLAGHGEPAGAPAPHPSDPPRSLPQPLPPADAPEPPTDAPTTPPAYGETGPADPTR
ncbi:general stress protein [Cryobacterium sp. 1639]|uniref:general stress protein n=1 Tax=Cryobacterium inferilacus TaxID=2866629 RepID=UPI002104B43E|nr:general stress protein [Cryobacterium sp. 1639]